ncbi:MAG: hypothetical protein HKN24_07245 [Acidimicrobiales bacterium]|nr:hypothetical protein [Acidimicrobiales bacterium]
MNVQLKERPNAETLPSKNGQVPVERRAPQPQQPKRSNRKTIMLASGVAAVTAALGVLVLNNSPSDISPVGETPNSVVVAPDHFSPGGNSLAPSRPAGVAADPDPFSPGGNSLAPSRPAGTRALPSDYFTPGGHSLSDGS